MILKQSSSNIDYISKPTDEMIVYYVKKNGELPKSYKKEYVSEEIIKVLNEMRKNPFKRNINKLETTFSDIMDYFPKIK